MCLYKILTDSFFAGFPSLFRTQIKTMTGDTYSQSSTSALTHSLTTQQQQHTARTHAHTHTHQTRNKRTRKIIYKNIPPSQKKKGRRNEQKPNISHTWVLWRGCGWVGGGGGKHNAWGCVSHSRSKTHGNDTIGETNIATRWSKHVESRLFRRQDRSAEVRHFRWFRVLCTVRVFKGRVDQLWYSWERAWNQEPTFRSKALESTILKIFWTLIEWEVEQKIRGARMAFANRRDWKKVGRKRTRWARTLTEEVGKLVHPPAE